MTTALLKLAFDAAGKLPDAEQDALARALLDELESERHIDSALVSNPAALERLADEVVAEHRTGRTTPLGLDE